jgi:hypothetical protein
MLATSVPATDVTAAVVVLLAAAAVSKVVVSKVQASIEAVVASVHCISVTHAACHRGFVARQYLVLVVLKLLFVCA